MGNQGTNWTLVLGGSSGIGLATAKKLARHGHSLILVHRDRRGAMKRLEADFAEIKEHAKQLITINKNALDDDGRFSILSEIADVIGDGKINLVLHSIALGNLKRAAPTAPKEPSQVAKHLAEQLGTPIETLNSAIASLEDLHPELTTLIETKLPKDSPEPLLNAEDFSQTIGYMGFNLLLWVQDLLQRGLFQDESMVLGLTSEGNLKAWDGYAAVSAAKCTLESVSRTIAKEFAPFGIRCNILQPGITDTPALRLIPGHKAMIDSAIKRNPLARMTTPEDVANLVYLMSLPEARWLNGSLIHVDGGEHIT